MALLILLPYDKGHPHLLWCNGETAVISANAAEVLRTYGIGMSSEYSLVMGQPAQPRLTYPSPVGLNIEGARQAADDGTLLRLSKKARSLLCMKLTVNDAVRAAFLNHSCPFDLLKSENLIRDDAFEVQFKADLHHTVISLAIDQNGIFKVTGSSCVPTEEYGAYLLAYGRCLAFTYEAGLKPKAT